MRLITIFLGIVFLCSVQSSLWAESDVQNAVEGTVYSPIGKRDPFKAVGDQAGDRPVASLRPIEKFGIDQLELKAVIHGNGPPRVMFEDPEGKVHIVTEGTVIGREQGVISRILNKEVIITERTTNYLGAESLFERVLSLPGQGDLEPLEERK